MWFPPYVSSIYSPVGFHPIFHCFFTQCFFTGGHLLIRCMSLCTDTSGSLLQGHLHHSELCQSHQLLLWKLPWSLRVIGEERGWEYSTGVPIHSTHSLFSIFIPSLVTRWCIVKACRCTVVFCAAPRGSGLLVKINFKIGTGTHNLSFLS